MPNLKVSLIIAFYKDLEALGLIVDALHNQTYKNFEVVIAEDDNAAETKSFLTKYDDLEIVHVSHPDTGRTKPVAQNKAILAATGEYLVFIDGDCIPYSRFIESHVTLAEVGKVLSGRRVNLGPKISSRLRKKTLSPLALEKMYLIYYPLLVLDVASHLEQGISLDPTGWFFSLRQKYKSNLSMLGCNFSCFKSDMLEINGFDESYGESAVPDDTDLQWRFEALGLQMKSCKLAANIFHLYHYRAPERYESRMSPELERMLARKKTGNYKAKLGLDSH
jgi:cellulose synthase/poly-beta-1,6-N-acetylglucosamine synthase-like glycosyltransferase